MNTAGMVVLAARTIFLAGLLLLERSACCAQSISSDWVDKTSALQLVPAEKLPRYGTFWSLQRSNYAPLPLFAPYLREAGAPVYRLNGERNVFLVDDSAFDYAALYKQREEERQMRRLGWQLGLLSDEQYWAEEGGAPEPMGYSYAPEDFWIEITGVTNHSAYLTLHGTVYSSTDWYQLLSKTNLAQSGEWTVRDLVQGAPGRNQTDLAPVDIGDHTNMFFRAQHTEGFVSIGFGPDAYEPNVIVPAGQASQFTISASPFAEDLPVYYRVGGTASNGVDYTNLTGVIIVPASTGTTNLYIQPLSDTLIEGSESVVVTLVQTNGYLINPGYRWHRSQSKTRPRASWCRLKFPPRHSSWMAHLGLLRKLQSFNYPAMMISEQTTRR